MITKNDGQTKNRKCDQSYYEKYTVIEYKRPEYSITVVDFYKTVDFSCQYKGCSKTVNEIHSAYSKESFAMQEDARRHIEEKYPGI